MERYQLRVPAHLGLDGLSLYLASAMRGTLDNLGLSWRSDNAVSLGETMNAMLHRHLVAYDSCGGSCICEEALTPVAWNVDPDPLLTSSDPRDRDKVLRVQFRFSSGEFYRFTALLARIAASSSDVDDARAMLAQEELERSVYQALSPFLFDAPICQTRERCQDAQPIDLWGEACLETPIL